MRWGSPKKNLRLIFSTIFPAQSRPRAPHMAPKRSLTESPREHIFLPRLSAKRSKTLRRRGASVQQTARRAAQAIPSFHTPPRPLRRTAPGGTRLPVCGGQTSRTTPPASRQTLALPPSRPELLSPSNKRVVTAFSHADARFHAAKYTTRFFPGVMRHSRHGTFRRQ